MTSPLPESHSCARNLDRAQIFGAGLSRGDLSEAVWRVLRELLPIDAPNRGRERRPERNRSIINGILWRLVAARRGRCSTKIRQLEHNLSEVSTVERSRGLGSRGRNASRDHGGQRSLQHR